MHINLTSSHLNGEEFLLVHKATMYRWIRKTVATAQAKDVLDKLRTHGWVECGGCEHKSYFMKERIAIGVRTDDDFFNLCELYDKHLALYIEDRIDVGIEILPMKTMQSQMSSGVAYYEGELYNVVRNGRGVPAVPLVILGIDA